MQTKTHFDHSYTFVWSSMKKPNENQVDVIVSNVVLWPKYINANGKRCCCIIVWVEDNIKPLSFHLYIYSNLSFLLNSSISRWFLNTFSDLSTTATKEVKKNQIVFLSLKMKHAKKNFNCLLYHSFSLRIYLLFLPLFNL